MLASPHPVRKARNRGWDARGRWPRSRPRKWSGSVALSGERPAEKVKLSDMQDERAQRGMTSDGTDDDRRGSDSPEPASDERKGWRPEARPSEEGSEGGLTPHEPGRDAEEEEEAEAEEKADGRMLAEAISDGATAGSVAPSGERPAGGPS
jgi:hypothetical protein